jgi:hypothetical protein
LKDFCLNFEESSLDFGEIFGVRVYAVISQTPADNIPAEIKLEGERFIALLYLFNS